MCGWTRSTAATRSKILDYYRRFQPERIAQHTVNFRLGSGGYDIVSIERSEPRHIELVVREKKTSTDGVRRRGPRADRPHPHRVVHADRDGSERRPIDSCGWTGRRERR